MQPQSLVSYHKGIGIGDNYREWNLLREDISLPAAVLSSENLEHNLRWMQKFIEKSNAKLAPHGKTTMTPKLFHKQLEHGAWAITFATVQQVQVGYAAGIRRVLMANQLVGKANMTIIQQLLEDPSFDFYCLIDSSTNVEQLGKFFQKKNARRLQVLLEIGVSNGRTGVRNEEEEQLLLNTLAQYQDSLELVGVELFEGVCSEEQPIRLMLQRAVACLQRLINSNQISRTLPVLTGAGSAWYDIVAEEFSKNSSTVDIILRPGCYLSHDAGVYRKAQTRILQQNTIAREISNDGGALQPALQIWAYVQSIPETNQAIIALGKRDAAFDAGYPTPVLHYRSEWSKPSTIDDNKYQITKMMDQHAFMSCPLDHNLMVGDIIAFDISHPCLTFDKWRKILLINNDYTVIDILDTYF